MWGLTTPLVLKADGTKFGKTESGTVWLDAGRTSPYQLYQFFLRSEDAVVGTYLRYFTFLAHEAILALDEATAGHPERREAQRELARQVCTLVHGRDETERAEQAAAALFGEDVALLDEQSILDVFADAPSTTAAPRPPGRRRGGRWSTCWSRPGWSRPRAGPAPPSNRGGPTSTTGGEDDVAGVIGPGDLLAGRYVVLRRGQEGLPPGAVRADPAVPPDRGGAPPRSYTDHHERPCRTIVGVSPVRLTTGLPETVLPEEPEAVRSGLEAALAQPADRRRHAVADVVRSEPRSLAAWAALGSLARDDVEAYACFRVGYHRGLDALRGAGGRARAWCGGPTSRTGGSSGASTGSARRPGPSASTTRRSGARSSSASSTRRGAPTGPGIPA